MHIGLENRARHFAQRADHRARFQIAIIAHHAIVADDRIIADIARPLDDRAFVNCAIFADMDIAFNDRVFGNPRRFGDLFFVKNLSKDILRGKQMPGIFQRHALIIVIQNHDARIVFFGVARHGRFKFFALIGASQNFFNISKNFIVQQINSRHF